MSGDSSFLSLLRLGASLAFVLGLIWVAAWIVRRRNGLSRLGLMSRGERGPGIEITERRSVGRHGSLAVVKVGERTLLVGITEQQVQLLGELDAPDDAADEHAPAAAPTRFVARREPDVDLSEHSGSGAWAADVTDTVIRRTGSRGMGGSRSARMNLVDALRELTVRRS